VGDDDKKAESKSKWVDRAFQLLALLVIPLLLWGIKLEVNNAVQDERIMELKEDLAKAEKMQDTITQNTHALIRLETKLDTAGETLSDIKRILRAP
jgi:hypothetical protein